MNENPTREEVRASIVPKSDQLNADDLLTGPITVKITKVSRGDKDQPISVAIEGHQPFKPCKSMRRVLIATWGEDSKAWIGQRMTLFCDPAVMWAGVKVGGIRISHLSGMEVPRNFLLTKSRGKRAEVTIQPLKTEAPKPLTAEEKALVTVYTNDINNATTLEALKEFGQLLAAKPQAIKDALHGPYRKRQAELTEAKPVSEDVKVLLDQYREEFERLGREGTDREVEALRVKAQDAVQHGDFDIKSAGLCEQWAREAKEALKRPKGDLFNR